MATTGRWKRTGDKHYCKYCNCWVQPDPLVIRTHEQGKRHKEAVASFLAAQRQRKADEAKHEKELEEQLDAIEKAANAAFEKDKSAFLGGDSIGAAPSAPEAWERRAEADASRSGPEPEAPVKVPRVLLGDDRVPVMGQYRAGGDLYLAAPFHADKIKVGSRVEVRVGGPMGAAWSPATVVAVTAVEPHAGMPHPGMGRGAGQSKLYAYAVNMGGEGGTRVDVAAPHVRLRVTPPPPVPMPPPLPPAAAAPDEATDTANDGAATEADVTGTGGGGDVPADDPFFGSGWTVTAVRQLSAEESRRDREAEAAQLEEDRVRHAASGGTDGAGAGMGGGDSAGGGGGEGEDEEGADAYATFNPYGGAYKGIKLSDEGDAGADGGGSGGGGGDGGPREAGGDADGGGSGAAAPPAAPGTSAAQTLASTASRAGRAAAPPKFSAGSDSDSDDDDDGGAAVAFKRRSVAGAKARRGGGIRKRSRFGM